MTPSKQAHSRSPPLHQPHIDRHIKRQGPPHAILEPIVAVAVSRHTRRTCNAQSLILRASQPILFCGDTLFSAGCGRVFEGTPVQMHASLGRLAALPDDTRVCCAHEYTLSNLRFAAQVEPDNEALAQHLAWCTRQREMGLPTLPSRIGLERAINPFLRCDAPAVCTAAAAHGPVAQASDVFARLREWKNRA